MKTIAQFRRKDTYTEYDEEKDSDTPYTVIADKKADIYLDIELNDYFSPIMRALTESMGTTYLNMPERWPEYTVRF